MGTMRQYLMRSPAGCPDVMRTNIDQAQASTQLAALLTAAQSWASEHSTSDLKCSTKEAEAAKSDAVKATQVGLQVGRLFAVYLQVSIVARLLNMLAKDGACSAGYNEDYVRAGKRQRGTTAWQ